MSREYQQGAPWDISMKMANLSVGGNEICDADWVSSVIVQKRPNSLTDQDYIGAPDQMAVLRATIALCLHLPEIALGDLHGIVSDYFIHCSFWGFYHGFLKKSPHLSAENVMRACELFENNFSDRTVKRVPYPERWAWKSEHHVAYFLLDCWQTIDFRCKLGGVLKWTNNVRLQFMFGLLGLFIRLVETGIITPSFRHFLRNFRAHHEHFEKFNKEVFSRRFNFNLTPLIEEQEKHDPEGHVAFFEGFFTILGANDWNFEGAYKRYGFVAQTMFIPVDSDGEDVDMV